MKKIFYISLLLFLCFTHSVFATNSDEFQISLSTITGDIVLDGHHTYSASDIPQFAFHHRFSTGLKGIFQKLLSSLPHQSPIITISQDKKIIYTTSLTSENISIPTSKLTPGTYTLQIKSGQTITTQDFSWGVLAMNTNKSHFLKNENSLFSFAVLDSRGSMVCDALLTLTITSPNGQVSTLSTANNTIKVNSDCFKKSVTDLPDYHAVFKNNQKTGTYKLDLTASTSSGVYSQSGQYQVVDSIPFEIERTSPTRICPPSFYPVTIKIKFNQQFSGTLTDIIPSDFKVLNPSQIKNTSDNKHTLSWDINASSGEIKTFQYYFSTPTRSPDFYTLGPLTLQNSTTTFSDNYYWQLAIDDNTSYSFQRKTWYDGTRYWRSYQDTTNSRIKFEYSTDGSSWNENTSARIDTNTSDFSILGTGTSAFITYSTNTVTNEDNLLTSNILGYWKMNEASWNGTANEVVDSSGNGYHGVRSGQATTTTGKFNNGGTFDGNTDYVTVTDQAGLRPGSSSWTMAAWINPSNVDQTTSILNKTNLASGMTYGLTVTGNIAGSVNGKKINGGLKEATSGNRRVSITSADVVDGNWHHVAMVLDKDADQTYMYIDGLSVGVTTDNSGTWPTVNNTDNLLFGSFIIAYHYNGIMDDIRLYNRALSANEIKTLAQPGFDIEIRQASSYPGTSFSWSNPTVLQNGSTESYLFQYPTLHSDSNNKLWVGSVGKSSTTFSFYGIQSSLPSLTTSWNTGTTLVSSTNSNMYGQIIGRTSGNSQAIYINGTTIESKNYNGTSWDGSPTSIGTGVTGLTNSLSALSDSSGNTHLLYVGVGGSTTYQEYTSSWQTAVILDSTAGNSYPTLSLNTLNDSLYAFWIRSNHIYYKSAASPYTSGSWGSATDWKTTGTNTYVTSNYSNSDLIYALWQDGSTVNWDKITIPTSTPTPTPTPTIAAPPGSFKLEGVKLNGIRLN